MVNDKMKQLDNTKLIFGMVIICCGLISIILAICLEKPNLLFYFWIPCYIAAIMFGVPFFVNRSKRKTK